MLTTQKDSDGWIDRLIATTMGGHELKRRETGSWYAIDAYASDGTKRTIASIYPYARTRRLRIVTPKAYAESAGIDWEKEGYAWHSIQTPSVEFTVEERDAGQERKLVDMLRQLANIS